MTDELDELLDHVMHSYGFYADADMDTIEPRFKQAILDLIAKECTKARREERIDILVDVQVRLMQLDSDKAKQRDLALDFVNAELTKDRE